MHAEELEEADWGLSFSLIEFGKAKDQVQPIMFEEVYTIAESMEMLEAIKQSSAVKPKVIKDISKKFEGLHLFVMIHGF